MWSTSVAQTKELTFIDVLLLLFICASISWFEALGNFKLFSQRSVFYVFLLLLKWIDCRYRRGRRRPGEYLCYQQVSRQNCDHVIPDKTMMIKVVVYHGVQKWKRSGQRFISLSCSDDIAAATFSSCMQTLPQMILRCHACASSCPDDIFGKYLPLRIKPKLFSLPGSGRFSIWHLAF